MTAVQTETRMSDYLDKADAARVARETIILVLEVHAPGFSKQLPSKEIIKDDGTNPASVSTSKFLIDKKKALKQINTHKSQFDSWLELREVRAPKMMRKGWHMIPLGTVEEVDQGVQRFIRERRELVKQHVIDPYEELKAQAKIDLKDHYRDEDYLPASELEERFAVDAQFTSFNVPAALQNIKREVYEREAQRWETQYREATVDIRDALRVSLAGMTDRLVNVLTPDAAGKQKKLYDSAVENIRTFLETFNARNLTDDYELAAVVQRAKQVLGTVNRKQLKDNDVLRAKVLEGFQQIDATLEQLVVTSSPRAFASKDEI